MRAAELIGCQVYDAGGELVISRQNTQSPPTGDSQAAVEVGAQVRVSWLPAQAFTIT